MADPRLLARARSFGTVAREYERARPDYPDDAVRFLLDRAPANVVDLGAGTGKLTRALVRLGHRVLAVEPSPAMLAQLFEQVPRAVGVCGVAEALPLRSRCADTVVAGQAFHWFDVDRALPEIARVLRPGGRLGLIWNRRDETVPWVRRLTTAMGGSAPGEHADPRTLLGASGLFGPVEPGRFRFWQRLDRPTLLALATSRSSVATKDAEQRAATLEQVGRLFDDVARSGSLLLPYVTDCFRARLLDSPAPGGAPAVFAPAAGSVPAS